MAVNQFIRPTSQVLAHYRDGRCGNWKLVPKRRCSEGNSVGGEVYVLARKRAQRVSAGAAANVLALGGAGISDLISQI
jgi:hypothetical protein